jgi:hypothetical protein
MSGAGSAAAALLAARDEPCYHHGVTERRSIMRRALTTAIILAFCVLPCALAAAQSSEAALEPGLLLIGGGSGSWGYFTLATSSDNAPSYISVYGWVGYTLAGGLCVGPYLSLSWDSSENTTASTSSSSLYLYPGFQVSYYLSAGSMMMFMQARETVQLGTSSSTASGTTTTNGFSLSGLSSSLSAGISASITDYLLLNVGPTMEYYTSIATTYDYHHFRLGFDLSFVVLL